MRANTDLLCDSIDAAIFSGDEFLVNAKAREELRWYMARWERGLKEHEAVALDLAKEGEGGDEPH